MSEADVRQVIQHLDQALRVLRQNEGRLTAAQVRVRSMISIARSEIAVSLSDAARERAKGAELFIASDVGGSPHSTAPFSEQRSA